MIKGIGVDIIEVKRIAMSLEKHDFAEKFFSDEERAYCDSKKKQSAQSYAARFAAKEAFVKALGTGFSNGSFKDIFVLKDYLESYAKYLGLDYEDVIDEFNEYMFEKTSKIPMEEIEKAVKEKEKEESESNRIASPYTKTAPIKSNKQFIFMLILITVLVIIAIIWSIKQITVGSTGANIAGYFNK